MTGAAIYLERHEDDSNLHRFYALEVVRDLFGAWQLTRSWGRVGARQGQSLVVAFETESQAREKASSMSKAKVRRGYLPA